MPIGRPPALKPPPLRRFYNCMNDKGNIFGTFEARKGSGRPSNQLAVERIERLGSEESLAGRRHSTNAKPLKPKKWYNIPYRYLLLSRTLNKSRPTLPKRALAVILWGVFRSRSLYEIRNIVRNRSLRLMCRMKRMSFFLPRFRGWAKWGGNLGVKRCEFGYICKAYALNMS